jgi:Protein of unknown function (DUF732)
MGDPPQPSSFNPSALQTSVDQEPTWAAPSTIAAPPPVTITETKPPPVHANVNPGTIAESNTLLTSHGLYTDESAQGLQETGRGICEHAAAGSSSADIDATQHGDNIPRAAAAQMVRDVITAFCPQYG